MYVMGFKIPFRIYVWITLQGCLVLAFLFSLTNGLLRLDKPDTIQLFLGFIQVVSSFFVFGLLSHYATKICKRRKLDEKAVPAANPFSGSRFTE